MWFDSAKTFIDKFDVFQSRLLRFTAGATWFVRNTDICRDAMISDNILLRDVVESNVCRNTMSLLSLALPGERKRRERNQSLSLRDVEE